MKNSKSIIALLIIAIVGVVGLTIAFFSNSSTITNEFSTNPYGTTVTEEFISPNNWLPGTTTDKTLVVTNTGSVDEAVRVSYEESWTSANAKANSQTGDLALSQNNNRAAIIHWTNANEWTTSTENGVEYRYYNYKLAPGDATSTLLESVEFNSLITNSATCDESESNGVKTITCNSNGSGYDGATYKLVFTIETVQYNKYVEAWGTSVAIAEEKPVPVVIPAGTSYLATTATNEANAEYNATTKKNMFAFTHGEGANAVTDYRYIGDAPNNYVYFNCDAPQEGVEYNYAASCEVWRILGTFSVDRTDPEDSTKTITETRMKLVRGTDLASTRMWDNRNSEQYSSGNYGKNDWNGSLMQTFLTGDYYNRTGDAADNGLKTSAQNMIDDAIFYLGGWNYSSSDTTYNAEKIYEMERGTETCVTTGTCSGGTRTTSWEGKVALMYPSDMYMTYAKTEGVGCYNQPMSSSVCGTTNGAYSWIYNTNVLQGSSSYQWTWFVSPYAVNSLYVFCGNSSNLSNDYGDSAGGVRPVVYLKSDIKIDGGTGEVGNPYVLK